jgi:hypothetical protein
VRVTLLAAIAALALAAAGCGGARTPTRTTGGLPIQPQDDPHPPPNVIVFRRIRYEGATMRTLYLHRDGTLDIEVPGGGTGASRFDGSVTPATLKAVEALVRRVRWNDLSPRKVALDGSGAYYMLRHGGTEHVAMASGMSADLVPVVKRLNGILNGEGRATHRLLHRFGRL